MLFEESQMKYRILALWNQFRTQVMSPAAPDVQVREMRKAFYAGVECTLNRLGQEMTPGDSCDDPQDERVIREVHQEIDEFVADVKAGRA